MHHEEGHPSALRDRLHEPTREITGAARVQRARAFSTPLDAAQALIAAASVYDEPALLRRRIGDNELDVITICRGYVEAQHEYASEVHDGATVNQSAQRIISTEGKHDGLAWRNPDGTWGGPVGSSVARAIEQGYAEKKPFHGYYFKVLQGQGPSARLGQLDYLIDGAMIGGFALVAWPAFFV